MLGRSSLHQEFFMSHSLTIGIGSCLSVLLFLIIDSKVCSFWLHFPNNFRRWEEERDSSGWKASWLHVFLCAEFGHVLRCRVVPSVLWGTSTETAHSGGVKSNFARNELHIPPACHSCIPPAAWPSLRSPVNPLENPSRGTEQVRPWSWGWHGWI